MSSLDCIRTLVITVTMTGVTLVADKRSQPTGGERAVPQTDGDGLEAPLPKGAIVRFGTTRFRAGSVVGSIKLSPDGKKLVSGGRSSGGGVFVWDAATGKRILWRPFGEEGEISGDGERLFLIEALPNPLPGANAKPPAPKTPAADPNLAKVAPPVEEKVSPLVAEVKNAIKIYQISTGKLLQQVEGSGHLYRVAIAPDECTLALEYNIPNVNVDPADFSANWFFKTRLELYDLKAGRVTHDLGELPQNYAGNGLVRFSADGKTLFAVSCSKENETGDESTVRRFDVATGALKSKTTIKGTGYQMPRGYHTPLNAANKTLILSGVRLWDLDQERQHWALKGNDLEAILAFMPHGRTAIAWTVKEKWLDPQNPSTSCKLVLWDLEADREIRRLPGISFSAVSPDGKTCYGANSPYRWSRYDLASGKEIDDLDAPAAPPESIAFSPDGKIVATTGSVWDRATGKCLHHLPGGARGILFFTADSKSLVYDASNLRRVNTPEGVIASLHMMDPATGKKSTREFEDFVADMNLYYCGLALSPDGRVLAGPYHLWDFASGKLIGNLNHDNVQARTSMFAFSPDSKKLAYFAPANRVQVWSIAEKKVVSDWPIDDHLDRNLAFVKGSELVASSHLPRLPPWRGMFREQPKNQIPADLPATMPPMPDAVVRVWDPATSKEQFRFQYPQNEYGEIPPLFAPDGKLLATASYYDEAVLFRDPASGKELGRFRCGIKGVHSMAFSPDSQFLAVSAKDTTVLLVDVKKVLTNP